MPDQDLAIMGHPQPHTNISTEANGPVRVLRIEGPLDWAASKRLGTLFQRDCVEPGVIVDLTGLIDGVEDALTSSLLAVAVLAGERGQQLIVVSPDRSLLEIFSETGLPAIVPIVHTQSAGIDYLHARGITV